MKIEYKKKKNKPNYINFITKVLRRKEEPIQITTLTMDIEQRELQKQVGAHKNQDLHCGIRNILC